jgi:hypothetical protein
MRHECDGRRRAGEFLFHPQARRSRHQFDLRYSTKDISDRERAGVALKGAFGKRLTYRRTAALAA